MFKVPLGESLFSLKIEVAFTLQAVVQGRDI